MKRVIQYILVTLMFAVPLAGFMTISNDYVIKSENRMIARFPNEYSNRFFIELVKWYTDRLFYKVRISEKYYKNFKDLFADYDFSPSEVFVKGRNNWVFLGDKSHEVYSQHSRSTKVNMNAAIKKINTLKTLMNADSAIDFYLVVGPDKHGIYPEYMNQNYFEPGKYRLFDNYKYLLEDAHINFIDNYSLLLNEKKKMNGESLYFFNDSHWNLYGAYLAYKNVMNQIYPDLAVKEYEFKFRKDHLPKGESDLLDIAYIDKDNKFDIVVEDLSTGKISSVIYDINSGTDYERRYINENAPENKKILIISDSFGYSFAPFAIDQFKEVLFRIRTTSDIDSLVDCVKKEKPDLIIYMNVERRVFN